MSFSKCVEIISKYFPSFLLGVKTTLIVALVGTIVGFIIGLFVGGIRAIKLDKTASKSKKIVKKIIDAIGKAYIDIFRGTPMMVQAVFIYYLVYSNIVRWDKMVAALFVISINTGAYMAEIIRAGIQSVDNGQYEAGRSIGLSSFDTMLYIVLPQAIKNAFPAIGNELIVNIKDSSVLSIISITELMFQSNSIAGTTYRFTETYLITALVYLFLTSISSIIMNYIEKVINHTKTSLPQSSTNFHSISIAKERSK